MDKQEIIEMMLKEAFSQDVIGQIVKCIEKKRMELFMTRKLSSTQE